MHKTFLQPASHRSATGSHCKVLWLPYYDKYCHYMLSLHIHANTAQMLVNVGTFDVCKQNSSAALQIGTIREEKFW